ncbi:MAG: cobalt ABC transporter permease [Gammaproteobacteria bacterium]
MNVWSMGVRRVVIGVLLIAAGIAAPLAYAHKVNVFAYVEGDQVYTQGYFSDGTKAKNSAVTVYGNAGQELLKGRTDEDGAFTFPTQGQRQALRIVLNAGMGHQASYVIPVEEVTGSPVTPAPASAAAAAPSSPRGEQAGDRDAGRTPSGLSEAQVRKAVAEGVLPLAREISALKERRGFSDIVGGIGLIIGVLGGFAYFKARQELRRGKGAKAGGT